MEIFELNINNVSKLDSKLNKVNFELSIDFESNLYLKQVVNILENLNLADVDIEEINDCSILVNIEETNLKSKLNVLTEVLESFYAETVMLKVKSNLDNKYLFIKEFYPLAFKFNLSEFDVKAVVSNNFNIPEYKDLMNNKSLLKLKEFNTSLDSDFVSSLQPNYGNKLVPNNNVDILIENEVELI